MLYIILYNFGWYGIGSQYDEIDNILIWKLSLLLLFVRRTEKPLRRETRTTIIVIGNSGKIVYNLLMVNYLFLRSRRTPSAYSAGTVLQYMISVKYRLKNVFKTNII